MADEFTFDFARRERIGLAEAVFCSGKTAEQIAHAVGLAKARAEPILLTRLSPDLFAMLADRSALDYDPFSRTAILGPWSPPGGDPAVAVVTAGTSDLPVAREAQRTLAFYGHAAREINDVGVAGLWRIRQHEEELRRYAAVIVVAGMDGALFSVIGGLVGGLVVAVPTSTGYGAARAGETALHSALTSCAPGMVAVNIDSGYGAACAAVRLLNQLHERRAPARAARS